MKTITFSLILFILVGNNVLAQNNDFRFINQHKAEKALNQALPERDKSIFVEEKINELNTAGWSDAEQHRSEFEKLYDYEKKAIECA